MPKEVKAHDSTWGSLHGITTWIGQIQFNYESLHPYARKEAICEKVRWWDKTIPIISNLA